MGKSIGSEFGYTCPCGAKHEADFYAIAHWDIELTHKCPFCGRNNIIKRGVVLNRKKKEKKK